MRKRYIALCIVILVVIMTFTRPSEEDFNRWLVSEYNILCNPEIGCERLVAKQGEDKYIETSVAPLDFKSASFTGYLLFMTAEKSFSDLHGHEFKIKALGIFGTFFALGDQQISHDRIINND